MKPTNYLKAEASSVRRNCKGPFHKIVASPDLNKCYAMVI